MSTKRNLWLENLLWSSRSCVITDFKHLLKDSYMDILDFFLSHIYVCLFPVMESQVLATCATQLYSWYIPFCFSLEADWMFYVLPASCMIFPCALLPNCLFIPQVAYLVLTGWLHSSEKHYSGVFTSWSVNCFVWRLYNLKAVWSWAGLPHWSIISTYSWLCVWMCEYVTDHVKEERDPLEDSDPVAF